MDDLQDTVPVDRVLSLQSGWGPFPKRNSGKLLLRLTYKAYVEDEEEIGIGDRPLTNKLWDEIGNFISNEMREGEFNSMERPSSSGKTTSVDAKSSDKGFRLTNPLITQTLRKSSSNGNVRVNSGNENPSNPTVKGPSMVENPALQDQQKKERSWGMQIQTVAKSKLSMYNPLFRSSYVPVTAVDGMMIRQLHWRLGNLQNFFCYCEWNMKVSMFCPSLTCFWVTRFLTCKWKFWLQAQQ